MRFALQSLEYGQARPEGLVFSKQDISLDLTSGAGRSKPGGGPRGAPLGLLLSTPVRGGWQGGQVCAVIVGADATWSITISFSDYCKVANAVSMQSAMHCILPDPGTCLQKAWSLVSGTMAWIPPAVLDARSPGESRKLLRWACWRWRPSAMAGRAGRLVRPPSAQAPPGAPQDPF